MSGDSVVAEEVVAYFKVVVAFQSDFDNIPDFQQSSVFVTVSCTIIYEPEF